MNNTLGQNPFQGMLPPLQTVRTQAPYAPPEPPDSQASSIPDIAQEAPQTARVAPHRASRVEEEPVIVDDQFTYDGFQVVRGEYFSHMNEPSITFSDNTFSININCSGA